MALTVRQSYLLGTTPEAARTVAPAILRKRVMTSQPQYAAQIDWGNPITRGLMVATIPSYSLRNICRNDYFSGTPKYSTSSIGVAYATDTSTSYILADDLAYRGSEVTALQFVRRSGTLAAYSVPFEKDFNSASPPSYLTWGIEYNGAVSGQNVINAFSSNGGSYARTSSYTVPDTSIPHVSALTRTSSTLSCYCNGELVAVSGGLSALTHSATGSNDIRINRLYSKSPFDVYIALAFNRALSPQEIKSLSDNPWQIFLAPNAQPWVATP